LVSGGWETEGGADLEGKGGEAYRLCRLQPKIRRGRVRIVDGAEVRLTTLYGMLLRMPALWGNGSWRKGAL